MLGGAGDAWLTRLHMMVARKLLASGWSQAEVAEILGTTQSTISRQRNRPYPGLKGSADEAVIDSWANELAQALIHLGSDIKVMRQRYVTEFQLSGNQVIRFDTTLTGTDLDEGQLRTALLRRLEWASSRLLVDTISPYLPEVGLNIAACTDEAAGAEDVCAFPGRLTRVGDTMKSIENATFGSSNHLAEVLLKARKHDRDKGAVLNLKPPMSSGKGMEVNMTSLRKACQELEWTLADAPKGKLNGKPEFCDVLIDAGEFGWEPTLYVLANNPLELVDRTHRLIASLK